MVMLKTFIVVSLVLYLGFGGLLYFVQRDLMYAPTPDLAHPYAEEIFINEGESIKVVVLGDHNSDAILYFGGNFESVERNAESFLANFPNHAVYLVKYRGYGGSTGSPKERAIYSDALHIFDQIKTRYENISVIGRSLGSGVATLLAVKRNLAGLALVTPFDSAESVAKKRYPLYPISVLMKDKYDSISRATSIRVPTLIVIAENDRIIEKEHGLRLAAEITSEQLTVEMLADTGHNNLDYNPKYHAALHDFFNKRP